MLTKTGNNGDSATCEHGSHLGCYRSIQLVNFRGRSRNFAVGVVPVLNENRTMAGIATTCLALSPVPVRQYSAKCTQAWGTYKSRNRFPTPIPSREGEACSSSAGAASRIPCGRLFRLKVPRCQAKRTSTAGHSVPRHYSSSFLSCGDMRLTRPSSVGTPDRDACP